MAATDFVGRIGSDLVKEARLKATNVCRPQSERLLNIRVMRTSFKPTMCDCLRVKFGEAYGP